MPITKPKRGFEEYKKGEKMNSLIKERVLFTLNAIYVDQEHKDLCLEDLDKEIERFKSYAESGQVFYEERFRDLLLFKKELGLEKGIAKIEGGEHVQI